MSYGEMTFEDRLMFAVDNGANLKRLFEEAREEIDSMMWVLSNAIDALNSPEEEVAFTLEGMTPEERKSHLRAILNTVVDDIYQ